LVAAAAAVLVAPSLRPTPARAAPVRELMIWGPPASASIGVAYAVSAGLLDKVADKVSFRAWRNPDEMRAGLTSGTLHASVMPTAVAANLFNRGFGLRLLNVMTNGLLYVVAADPALDRIEALKGRTIAVPFRGDTPEFVFNRLLGQLKLAAGIDLKVETAGTPVEAIQLLLAGRIDAALVPEPAASAAIARAAAAGRTVTRVMDLQRVWAAVTGRSPVLPHAGLGVTDAFRLQHPQAVEALHEGLARAVATVIAKPALGAHAAAAVLDLPAPVIERSIPFSNLVSNRARDARPDLETLFATVAEHDARVIGGKLPAASFYL
jgi:NitT/TauT family transport system substrate-binding protein